MSTDLDVQVAGLVAYFLGQDAAPDNPGGMRDYLNNVAQRPIYPKQSPPVIWNLLNGLPSPTENISSASAPSRR